LLRVIGCRTQPDGARTSLGTTALSGLQPTRATITSRKCHAAVVEITNNNSVSFRVYGTPAPQGSMRGFVVGKRAVVTGDNTKTKPWKEAVKFAALDAVGSPMLDGPIATSVTFFLPKGTSIPKKRTWPWKKPDLDKLLRSTWDGITEAGLWVDDSQVVVSHGQKRYATDTPAGAIITVTQLEG
jgi:Holliday junction resolvase RusA-like endonuclease